MRWVLSCVAALAVCAGVWSGPAKAAPLEAYGRLPSLENVEISPDGANIAFVVTTGEARKLLVKRLADGKVVGVLNLGDSKLRSLEWADAQHILVTTSVAGHAAGVESAATEWRMAQVYDLGRRHASLLMDEMRDAMNVVTSAPMVRTVNGHTLLFFQGVYLSSDRGVEGLFETDLTTNRSRLVKAGDENTRRWLVDAAGQPVAESRYVQATGTWSLRVRLSDGRWVVSRTIAAPLDSPTVHGLGRDGRSVLVSVFENGASTLHEVSTADGSWGPPIPNPYRQHLDDPVTHAWAGGVELDGDDLRYTFFDPPFARHWAATTKAYSGEQVSLVSWSADRMKLIVLVNGADDGPAYALVDLNTKRGEWIGNRYADVKPADIAPVTPVSYKAADGTVITGYLTLPRGKPGKDLPLVVLPHGGPAARDEPGFDWWAQAVASRGYAVLQPNFRGSSGFTIQFEVAGYGQWGRKMQTDLSDGVRYLAGKGTIDPKRVCIFGGGYGGYAALAGATIDTGVYRCAVSVAGPSDLRLVLREVLNYRGGEKGETLRYWDRFMGAKGANDLALDAISPAHLAAKVTIPVLLIQGKDDTVVPFEQSQIMADALRRAGKPVTLVALKGEDHWLSRSETRLQMLTAAMAFIEANNPPN